MTVDINWDELGFNYMDLPYRYIARGRTARGMKVS